MVDCRSKLAAESSSHSTTPIRKMEMDRFVILTDRKYRKYPPSQIYTVNNLVIAVASAMLTEHFTLLHQIFLSSVSVKTFKTYPSANFIAKFNKYNALRIPPITTVNSNGMTVRVIIIYNMSIYVKSLEKKRENSILAALHVYADNKLC